jgi:hypothetical protein
LFITVGHKRSAENIITNYQFKTKVNMKNKTSILVGTRHFFYALLVAVIFCGCESKNVTVEETSTTINGREMKIYIIDSCEYIGTIHGSNADVITHKGNCKFCAERSKK